MTARKPVAAIRRCPSADVWVVFMPDGFPCGVMTATTGIGTDVVKAARAHWGNGTEALKHLAAGYRIELTPRERWRNELMPIHLGDLPWTGGVS